MVYGLASFQRSRPTFYLRESQTQQLLNELVGGRLDVVLIALPVKHADIESELVRGSLFTRVTEIEADACQDGYAWSHDARSAALA